MTTPNHESPIPQEYSSLLNTILKGLESRITEYRTRTDYDPDGHQDNVLDAAYDVVNAIMDTHPHIAVMPDLTEILDKMKAEGNLDDEVYELIMSQI